MRGLQRSWIRAASVALAVALLAAGCDRSAVRGSGEAASEVRQVGAFRGIEIAGALNAEISKGDQARVEVSGDDNLVPLVTTEVAGGRLRVETKKPIRPELELEVRIIVPEVRRVTLSGAGRVTLSEIDSDELALALSGSGSIAASGATGRLALEISGSGSVDAGELRAEVVEVAVSGAGAVTVHATRSLEVSISGSGTVTYGGEPPEVRESISGSGRLVKR
jgi:carbon monoxide dehydrogenase subunit G